MFGAAGAALPTFVELSRFKDGRATGGAVTFLFTDIEGSTRLVKQLREQWGEVLSQHQALLRDAFLNHSGYEVDTQGDSFFVAFVSARDAVRAAVEGQRTIRSPGGRTKRKSTYGWASIPGRRWYPTVATPASRCTGRHESAPPATGVRSSSRQQHRPCSKTRRRTSTFRSATSASNASRISTDPSALYQVEADGLPTKFPPLRHEAELAEAAETALAAQKPPLRRLAFVGAALAVAAAAAVAIVLLSAGNDVVTVRPNSVGIINPKRNKVVDEISVGRSRPDHGGCGCDLGGEPRRPDALSHRSGQRLGGQENPAPRHTYGSRLRRTSGLGGERTARDRAACGHRIQHGRGADPDGRGPCRRGKHRLRLGFVWFASANSIVKRLDPNSEKVIATLTSGLSPSGIAVDDEAIWVANKASNDVYKFSPTTNQQVTTPYSSLQPPDCDRDRRPCSLDRLWRRQRRHSDRPAHGREHHDHRRQPPVGDRLRRPRSLDRQRRRRHRLAYRPYDQQGDQDSGREQPEGIVVAQNRVWVTVQAP